MSLKYEPSQTHNMNPNRRTRKQVYQITGLTRLKLLHNELPELPDDIGNLVHLVNP